MKFAEPLWLLAGLAVLAVLFALYRRIDSRQRAALAEFASNHLLAKLTASFSPGRRRVKRVLFSAALAFVFIALARPQFGYHWEEQKQRGIDILFAVDTSKSMLTQDVTPDRLTRAKLAITDFVNKLDGDRVGLIAFAGDAFLQAPLTLDYNAFGESLDALDTNTIPRGGTDISSAITEAQVAFGKESKNKKILVLITDGEDLEAKGIDSARTAAADGLTIYTIGVGSASGGLIPVPGANGGTDFVKDASGQFVKSHLDESTLKQIAGASGGLYEPLGQQGQGLQAIYDQALASLPKQDLASRTQKVFEERFQWPLAAGILCLFASMMIGTRRRTVPVAPRAQKAVRAASALGMVALFVTTSMAHASVQSAEQAYNKGDYSDAQKQYEQATTQRPDAAPLQYNLGASAYKSGQFDAALPAFQKALSTDQVGIQQQAYYDMGNTQYRIGQKSEKSKPDDAIKTWQSAVQSYEAALKLKPDDADAKFNHDFVQKKLEQLQKQQQQQKQDQKQNQNQKQDQQNKDQNQQQNQDQNKDQKQDQNQKDDQANNQKSGQQGDKQDQKSGDQKQDQNTAQNGKPDQQKQGDSKQDQAQNGKQDQQNQGGQQGQPKDQPGQQQTAGNQDQKPDQQGQQGDRNSQTAQNGDKPAGQRGQTVPDKDQPKPQPQPSGDVAQTGTPGEMTAQEAKDLLNSMKSGEHVLSVTADSRNPANHPQDQQTIKDW